MSRLTRGYIIALPVRGYHPLRPCFPDRFRLSLMCHWPDPRSLATTNGVSVDVLSSRYLDVSVPWVRFEPPMCSGAQSFPVTRIRPNPTPRLSPDRQACTNTCRKGVSPFGDLRIKVRSQLPGAYRSVPRPSSPLSAKASTECP